MKKIAFIIFVLTSILFYACNGERDNIEDVTPFTEIADIATVHGNLNSEVAIVNTQGGPETNLDDETLKEIMLFTETSDLLYVNVHQTQTKEPNQFLKRDITFEEAKKHSERSVLYLKEVIKHLKKQNKTVFVLGISFGAFVTQKLIADYGPDLADGFLIMVGRLDIDEATWKPFSEGKYTSYKYDNIGNYEITEISEDFDIEERNMAKLAAGLGFNRFTKKLADINDLSKIIYVYGDRDQEVGVLSEYEIEFLNTKGAQVILSEDSDHNDAIFTGLKILKNIFEN